MRWIICYSFIFSFIFLAQTSGEKLDPLVENQKKIWENNRAAAIGKVETLYLKKLEETKTNLVKLGKLAEARAYENAKTSKEKSDNDPPSLVKMREIKLKLIAEATRKVDQTYWKKLQSIKKEILAKGDLEGAEFVQTEMKRVASMNEAKVPATGAEKQSPPFGKEEQAKRPPPKLTDKAEILDVKIIESEVNFGEDFTVVVLVRSFTKPTLGGVGFTWSEANARSGMRYTSNMDVKEKIDDYTWKFTRKLRFSNEIQVGGHQFSSLYVDNEVPKQTGFSISDFRGDREELKIIVLPKGEKKNSKPKNDSEGLGSKQERPTQKIITPLKSKRPIIKSIEVSTNKLIGGGDVDFKVTYLATNKLKCLWFKKTWKGSSSNTGNSLSRSRILDEEGHWVEKFTVNFPAAKIGTHKFTDFYLEDTADVTGPEKKSTITIRVYKKPEQ